MLILHALCLLLVLPLAAEAHQSDLNASSNDQAKAQVSETDCNPAQKLYGSKTCLSRVSDMTIDDGNLCGALSDGDPSRFKDILQLSLLACELLQEGLNLPDDLKPFPPDIRGFPDHTETAIRKAKNAVYSDASLNARFSDLKMGKQVCEQKLEEVRLYRNKQEIDAISVQNEENSSKIKFIAETINKLLPSFFESVWKEVLNMIERLEQLLKERHAVLLRELLDNTRDFFVQKLNEFRSLLSEASLEQLQHIIGPVLLIVVSIVTCWYLVTTNEQSADAMAGFFVLAAGGVVVVGENRVISLCAAILIVGGLTRLLYRARLYLFAMGVVLICSCYDVSYGRISVFLACTLLLFNPAYNLAFTGQSRHFYSSMWFSGGPHGQPTQTPHQVAASTSAVTVFMRPGHRSSASNVHRLKSAGRPLKRRDSFVGLGRTLGVQGT